MGRVAERRARMLDEIVDAALAVMAEHGASGLTLGEVARRVGMRTPSLYGYVASRADLCDEVFRRGWVLMNDATRHVLEQVLADPDSDPGDAMLAGMTAVVGWALDHPGHAQLMFWRPIPGWQPSPEAFAPAIESLGQSVAAIRVFQERGLLDDRTPAEEIAQMYGVLSAGVISQQLSNEPGIPLSQGRASRHLESLARMFIAHHQPDPARSTS